MQIILIAAAVLVLLSAVEGFRHGVIRRAIEVLGLLAMFVFASSLAGAVEERLADQLGLSQELAFFGSWIGVLVVGVIGVRLLALTISKVLRFSIIGWLDRAGGATLGVAFGAVLVSCALVGLVAAPIDDDFKTEIREHPVAGPLLRVAPAVYDVVRQVWDGEAFFDMVRSAEPAARRAAEELRSGP